MLGKADIVGARPVRAVPFVFLLQTYRHGSDRLSVFIPRAFEQYKFVIYFNTSNNRCSHTSPANSYGIEALVVVHTERLVSLCSVLFMEIYDEYKLWYVLFDIISFARQLRMAVEVSLCALANVLKVLEVVEFIGKTRFGRTPDRWRKQTTPSINDQSGCTGRQADYSYFDPVFRTKSTRTRDSRTRQRRVSCPMTIYMGLLSRMT